MQLPFCFFSSWRARYLSCCSICRYPDRWLVCFCYSLRCCYVSGPCFSIESTANGILRHLSLLFVPAGVGVVIHFSRIGSEWLPITVALIMSTLITLAVTAFSLRLIKHLLRPAPADHDR